MFRDIKLREVKIETDTVVGEALKIGDRTLYPVIRVVTINREGEGFFGVWVSPLAMVVIEPAQEYALPLTEETVTLEKLLEIVPSLKEDIKKVQRRRPL
ncbi:MAG: hypothetical protein L6N95_01965 [Candidatus Methylarchaceae archaeon HK01B]|nr:hypothetical protein [Candidatus Methylarchaceae archaeon HK01M]MCP8312633.1 hypothetical protein [Candidatus Methylarchaceae archaeon HK02M1]MCP8318579.1 hypothetical protein [Candidatus Methylarchaceae archaeon HK01B]